MKIDIEKDNVFTQYYSAMIEDEDIFENPIWETYEIFNPVGYGKTPVKALKELVRKLEKII